MANHKVIDSHLHVWANSKEAALHFPYIQVPSDPLRDKACTSALLQQMQDASVDGALIVQPINYKFDHSYVRQAIRDHPTQFKAMMLYDPSLQEEEAVARLEELVLAGFVGVRFNPYLWTQIGDNEWSYMSEGAGLTVYRRCGELKVPVGIMCFRGLSKHYNDICQLLAKAPDTKMILDHFGFTSLHKHDDGKAFQQLLQLAKYDNVYVKISALFRMDDPSPYSNVYKQRFLPLLETFGADRLLYGSDFPFVLEQPEQYKIVDLVTSWCPDHATRTAIMGGTAETLFGNWG